MSDFEPSTDIVLESDFESYTEIIKAMGGARKLEAGINQPPGRVQNWSYRNRMPNYAWWPTYQYGLSLDPRVVATVENMALIADKQKEIADKQQDAK